MMTSSTSSNVQKTEKSRLVSFYEGKGTDGSGRLFEFVLSQDDDWWESTHDFIQWVFPLNERSLYNPEAPLITGADVEAFKTDSKIRRNFARACDRFDVFLGLAPLRKDKLERWGRPGDHNLLRVSRYLKSMVLTGMQHRPLTTFETLTGPMVKNATRIPVESIEIWKQSVKV